MFPVDIRDTMAEQRELLAFLDRIRAVLEDAQRLHPDTTVQIYLWDSLQYDHLTRGIADRVVPLASASERLRWSAAVAEMGLALRHAPGLAKGAFGSARTLAASAIGSDATGERREFLSLMDKASSLGAAVAR